MHGRYRAPRNVSDPEITVTTTRCAPGARPVIGNRICPVPTVARSSDALYTAPSTSTFTVPWPAPVSSRRTISVPTAWTSTKLAAVLLVVGVVVVDVHVPPTRHRAGTIAPVNRTACCHPAWV